MGDSAKENRGTKTAPIAGQKRGATTPETEVATKAPKTSSNHFASPQKIWTQPVGSDDPLNTIVEPIDALRTTIMPYLCEKRLFLLRGSCQSGKTSLLLRMVFYAKQGKGVVEENPLEGYNVHLADGKRIHELNQFVDSHNEDSKSLILFDEAHIWFGNREADAALQTLLKQQSAIRCLFATTSSLGDNETKFTPAELAAHQFWFHAPSTDMEKAEQFMQHRLEGTVWEGAVCANSLFRYCGNHVGLLSATVTLLLESKEMDIVITPLQLEDQRSLGAGNGPPTPRQEDIYREIMASGQVALNFMACDNDAKSLIRKGYISPVRLNDTAAVTKVEPEGDTLFTFNHSFQAEVFEKRYGPISKYRECAAPPLGKQSPLTVLFHTLPFIPSTSFLSAEIGTNYLSEYSLQHGMSIALSRAGFYNIPEFPVPPTKKKPVGRPSSIDFYIPRSKVILELVTNVNTINEHANSFKRGEKYRGRPSGSKYLIVIFAVSVPEVALPANCCVVTPDPVVGWNAMHVLLADERRCTVARDMVPRDEQGKSIAQYRGPAPSRVWVRDAETDTTFTVVPEQNTVDSLKKAIAPELYPRQQAAMRIFEWDVQENEPKEVPVVKQSTTLDNNTEETPYVFEV